jgi:hypothetical protein
MPRVEWPGQHDIRGQWANPVRNSVPIRLRPGQTEGCDPEPLARRRSPVEAYEPARQAGTPRSGQEDPAKAGGVEHRGQADISETGIDPAALGIDGIGLDPWRTGRASRCDDRTEQGSGDSAPAVANPDPEAADRPYGQLVDRRNDTRAIEPGRRASDADAAPADRLAVEVGDKAGRGWPRIDLGAEHGRPGQRRLSGPAGQATPGLAPAATVGTITAEEQLDVRPAIGRRWTHLDLVRRGSHRSTIPGPAAGWAGRVGGRGQVGRTRVSLGSARAGRQSAPSLLPFAT